MIQLDRILGGFFSQAMTRFRKAPGRAVIATGLFCLAAWGAYRFLAGPTGVEPLKIAQKATVPQTIHAKPKNRVTKPTTAMDRGDNAREVIERARSGGKAPDLAAIHARAMEFFRAGQLADAYLLHFFAARRGHGPSIVRLGEMSDPLQHLKIGSVLDEPDPDQAFKWYSKALNLGVSGAKERLADLRAWVKSQSDKGDPNARRLLMQWP